MKKTREEFIQEELDKNISPRKDKLKDRIDKQKVRINAIVDKRNQAQIMLKEQQLILDRMMGTIAGIEMIEQFYLSELERSRKGKNDTKNTGEAETI